jgi:hypothetical protein
MRRSGEEELMPAFLGAERRGADVRSCTMQVPRPIRPLTSTLKAGPLLTERYPEDRCSCPLTIYELSVSSQMTIYNLS